MKYFHDAYLTTDVLLLPDVLENFRSICMQNYSRLRNDLYCVEWGVKLYSNKRMQNYELDPAHFYTTSGLSF